MDDLIEQARLTRVKWAEADGRARLMEEQRKVVLAEIFNNQEGSAAMREKQAYAHPRYKDHIGEMVQKRTEANILWATVLAQSQNFDRWRTKESSRRAEMQLR